MTSARHHTDGVHSDNTPTESMIETPQTFAAKLREIGYTEPVLPRDTESPEYARWLKAQDKYIKARPTFWSRCRDLLGRIAGPLVLLVFIVLTTFACARLASGAEVPAWVMRGIAQVETGTDWRDIGDVRGTWARGSIGEVGPWQLSPAVLRDLKAYDRRFRIHADPVLAESLTRAWLLRLYGVTGCWHQTCAAFHAGLGKRFAGFATDYAERVRAVGTTAN